MNGYAGTVEIPDILYGRTLVRKMTASDLGIVDELLDDKIGMEPPRVFLPLMRKPSNPLDGTRLWDNS